MSVVKHIPDTTPGPTGTSCLGYPRATWPPLTSSFCANPSRDNERHKVQPTRVYLPLPHPLEIKAGTPRETRLRLPTSSSACEETGTASDPRGRRGSDAS